MRINDAFRPSKGDYNPLHKVILILGIISILISVALGIILTVKTGKLNKIYGINKSIIEVSCYFLCT